MDTLDTREIALASELLAYGPEQLLEAFGAHEPVEMPVTHHFGPGVYIRELAIPAGTLAVGKHHRGSSLNLVLKGRLVICVDGRTSVVEAPFMMVSGPGRKAVYALEDAVWQSVIATDETDPAVIEAMVIDACPQIAEARS